ncbi:MAG: nucleotide-binding protein [Thermoanaerobaculia bacterium]|nr:nucleotide-binding protein [Thermoanaerobaculia bacterium]
MRRSVLVLALVFFAGCGKKPAAPAAGAANPDSPAHGAPLKASAPAAVIPQAPQPALAAVSGVVEETLDASDYTYMRLKTGAGEIWAAVTKTPVKKGDRVTVVNAMSMDGFESKTLNRKFERIVFGSLGDENAGAPAAPVSAHGGAAEASKGARGAPLAAPHAKVADGSADAPDVKVPKAEGKDARTVAQVFAERARLKDKTVTVRGKVVKANTGIMGRNWYHIRDGSGSREKKDDDLTVTTGDPAAVGDIVVVRGVVHVDKDFGAGYLYPVVLEDAKVTKEPASTRADASRP